MTAPWIMDFDSIVSAIVLELGTEIGAARAALTDKALVVAALHKYYNPGSEWGFEEIASVMAEQVLNRIHESSCPF